MRTITLICALFLLTSCTHNHKVANDQTPFGGPGDSSPIKISDGSILITQGIHGDHFRMFDPKHAGIKMRFYQPYTFGYLCTTGVDCPATPAVPCTASPTAKCTVDVSAAASWGLSLCEGATSSACAAPTPPVTVLMSWTNGDYESIDILSNVNPFTVQKATAAIGAQLHHTLSAGSALQSGTLQVTTGATPVTYTLACLTGANPCVTVDYSCHISGNAKCGEN
jgi:hypothetical protein